MNATSVYRAGGIAAILSVVLSVAAMAAPVLLALGSLALAVFLFALYRVFSGGAKVASLVATALGIAGALVLLVLSLPSGAASNATTAIASWAAWLLPPLVFGWLAFRRGESGLPRSWALIGIAAGVFGLLNLILVLIGGGNWAAPNNPALVPVLNLTYYLAMLFALVWMGWTAVLLLKSAAAPRQQLA